MFKQFFSVLVLGLLSVNSWAALKTSGTRLHFSLKQYQIISEPYSYTKYKNYDQNLGTEDGWLLRIEAPNKPVRYGIALDHSTKIILLNANEVIAEKDVSRCFGYMCWYAINYLQFHLNSKQMGALVQGIVKANMAFIDKPTLSWTNFLVDHCFIANDQAAADHEEDRICYASNRLGSGYGFTSYSGHTVMNNGIDIFLYQKPNPSIADKFWYLLESGSRSETIPIYHLQPANDGKFNTAGLVLTITADKL